MPHEMLIMFDCIVSIRRNPFVRVEDFVLYVLTIMLHAKSIVGKPQSKMGQLSMDDEK